MLLVDRREGSHDLCAPLAKMGLPAQMWDLPSGDLAFEGRGERGKPVNIGIEFKKLGELVQAMRTERLQGHQLLKMREAFDVSYLLVEGELHYDGKGQLLAHGRRGRLRAIPGGMSVGELLKRLHVLHLRGGLNLIRTRNRPDSLKEIEAVYRVWTDKDADQHTSHIAIYQAPTLVPISEFRGFMTRLEGVGLKASKAAEEHFGGSVRTAVNASRAEWMKVEGIGPKIADHIMEVFGG